MIAQILRRHGIARIPHRLDRDVFTRATPDMAYWLGFIFADGSVEDYRLKVELKSDERAHLATLLAFLGSDAPVRQVARYDRRIGKTYHNANIRVYSRAFIASLAALGVHPRK